MSQQINLLNPLFRPQRFSATSAEAMLYGVGIVLGACVLYAVYLNYRLSGLEHEAQTTGQEYQDLGARRDTLTAQQASHTPDARLAAEITALQSQLSLRTAIIDTLKSGALGTTLGFSEYLRAFSRESVAGLWLTGFDIRSAGNQLTLEGRTLGAELLPEYLKRLNRESVLQGRQFSALSLRRPPPPEPDAAATATAAPATLTQPSATAPAAAVPATAVTAAPPPYLEFTITTDSTVSGAGGSQP